MPIPSSHIKERLSVAHVSAIAARAGVSCGLFAQPEYGIDVQIADVQELPNGKITNSGHMFYCQLKATTTGTVKDDHVLYDLDVDAYNKLVQWRGASPVLLVLLCLPRDEAEWLALSEDELLLRRCCYWTHLQGPMSENRRSERIRLPRSQLFTPDSILELLGRVRRGDFDHA